MQVVGWTQRADPARGVRVDQRDDVVLLTRPLKNGQRIAWADVQTFVDAAALLEEVMLHHLQDAGIDLDGVNVIQRCDPAQRLEDAIGGRADRQTLAVPGPTRTPLGGRSRENAAGVV